MVSDVLSGEKDAEGKAVEEIPGGQQTRYRSQGESSALCVHAIDDTSHISHMQHKRTIKTSVTYFFFLPFMKAEISAT